MIWFHTTKKTSLFGIAIFCALCFSNARPKDLESFYRVWKPLELVRGLRSLSVDPFDVFRALEAVKELDSEEALDVMHELDVRPITVYDALEDLGVHPFDAYYALKAWLTDPLLHQPGDHYHRVNASGDPTHPYLHVLYKKSKDGKSDEEYKAVYLTSREVEEELKEIEKEYKEACEDEKVRMNEFINKAKKVHAAFDDPTKVFEDFFGKRHFKEWSKIFPEAFKHLKEIYKNPLGFGLKKDRAVLNDTTTKQDKLYEYLQKGREYINKERQKWDSESLCLQGDAFSQYNDPKRYDTLQDETHTENLNPPPGGDKVKKRIYHTKVFYDKFKNIYVECKQIQELKQTGNGVSRKTKTCIRQFDPKSYESYRQQLQEEQLKEEQKKRQQLHKMDQQQPQHQQQEQQQQQQQQTDQQRQPHPNQQQQPQPEQSQQQRPDQQQQQQPQPDQQQQQHQPQPDQQQQQPQTDQQQQQQQSQPDQQQQQQQPQPDQQQQQQQPQPQPNQQQYPYNQPWQQPYQHYPPQPSNQQQQHYYPQQFYPYQYQQYHYPQYPHNQHPYHPHNVNQQPPQPHHHQHPHQENQPQNQDQQPPHQTEPNPHAGG